MFYPSHIPKDYFLFLLQVVVECVGGSVQRLRSTADILRNSCEVEAFQRKPLLTNTQDPVGPQAAPCQFASLLVFPGNKHCSLCSPSRKEVFCFSAPLFEYSSKQLLTCPRRYKIAKWTWKESCKSCHILLNFIKYVRKVHITKLYRRSTNQTKKIK